MKTNTSLLCLCAALAQSASAVVVTGINIDLSDGSFAGADYALTVYQDESATDPTSIFFDVTNSTLSIVTYNVDEASDWFLTSLTDEFSETTVGNNNFPILIQHTPSFQTNDLNTGFEDFYLGVNTGNDLGSGFPPRNIYGWAKLRNIDGSLTLLENAVSYQGTGIIVGTTQVVPEPSASVLIGGLFAAFAVMNRRRK
jgi:hypothetical protein